MKQETSLKIVEDYLGIDLPVNNEGDFIPALDIFSKLSFEEKKKLTNNLKEYGKKSWEDKSKTVLKLEGYKAFQEINISRYRDYTINGMQALRDNLLKQLLYFPKIVVVDFGTNLDLNDESGLINSAFWFTFLKQVKDLTDNGIIFLVPEIKTEFDLSLLLPNNTVVNEGIDLVISSAAELPRLSSHPIFSKVYDSEVVLKFFRNIFSDRNIGFSAEKFNMDQFINLTYVFDNALLFMISNQLECHPAFIDRYSWEMAKLSLEKASEKINRQSELDTIAAITLAEVAIPNLHSLSVSDYVEIRKNEKMFERWRSSFSKALELPLSKNDDKIFDVDFIRSNKINDILDDEAKTLKAQINSSSLKPRLVQFASTLMVGGATALTNNPKLLPGVAAGAFAGLMTSLFFQRNKKRKVALKFFSLFKCPWS